MDAQRALLDSLMGAERNAALEDREKFRRKFHDRSICKPFLCGLCPIETLAQTKSEVLTGEHRAGSEHDLRCKQEWENLDPEERKEYGYEYDLLEWLDKLVKECDATIASEKKRVAEKAEEPPPEKKLSEEEQERVLKLTAEIDELVVEAERLGENGEVEKSKAVGEKVEALKFQIDQIKKPDKPRSFPNRSLVVCEVSGNLLCSTDTEDRKARHYAGRHYTGWTAIRAKLEELKKDVGERPSDWRPMRQKNGDGRSSGNNRDRSRERGDRDRDRDRDRRRGDRDRRERDHRDRDRRDRRRRRDRSDSRDRRRRRDRSRSRSRRRR